MTDPLALLPLAAAARGGRIGPFEATRLVAAGLTLLRRSAPLVRALSGRRAAILLPTGPAYLTALAACEGRGAVLINPLAAPPEIAHQVSDADVGAILTTESLLPRTPGHLTRVLLDGAPTTARVMDRGSVREIDLGAHFGLELEGDTDATGREEECAIVYTSAMAGVPLGAILTHRNLLANARATLLAAELGPEDHALALLPFAHLFGLTVTLMAPLLAGGRVTPVERFQPARAIERLEGEGVTLLVGVPSVYVALLDALARRGSPLRAPRLRVCICGGAPLDAAVQDRWAEATGVELRQGYGLTEAGPVCLFNPTRLPNRRGLLGAPLPGVEVSIRDPVSGQPLPSRTEGEICVRGENVFAGYVREAADGLERRDGWLHTGDLGAAEEGGFVTFRGVLKDMFTRNGFNVYPREIERVVTAMPGVESARVRPFPDPPRGNGIALDYTGPALDADVRRWCEERLAAYKQPGAIRNGSA